MEVCGQFQDQAALRLEKGTLGYIGQETGYIPEPLWTRLGTRNVSRCRELNSDC